MTPLDYTEDDVKRLRKSGQVTSNGVVYDWGLSGPQGAWFTLIKTPRMEASKLRQAEAELRRDRDVVTLRVGHLVSGRRR